VQKYFDGLNTPAKIYRVQAGAFIVKSNAEAYLKRFRLQDLKVAFVKSE
jgi:hypothetical protein